MTLVKRFNSPFESVPSLFDDFITKDFFGRQPSPFKNSLPPVNIKEDADSFTVELAAPGLKKEDFKLELEENVLTISVESKAENETKTEAGYTRKEFSYQSFKRSFTVPERLVDADRIGARYEDGILHLSIPKKEEAKQKGPRLIEIG